MEENKIVKKIADYIELHLAEDLSLDNIAKELNYSKFYIERTFTQKTGITIYKYIQRRRLTQAARQLVESDKPITDIAYDAHYNSHQAFTLAFRTLYRCSPKTFRKNGVFYPKQTKISLHSAISSISFTNNLWGGRMAA